MELKGRGYKEEKGRGFVLPLPNGASVYLASFSKNQKRWLLEGDDDGYGIVKVRMKGELLESSERIF